jgi:methionyl-tRNA formyltransferase
MLAALLRAGHAPIHVYEEDSEMARMKGPWWNNLVAERHAPLPLQLAQQIAEYNSSASVPIAHSVVRNHNECADAIRADVVDLLVLANTRIIKAEVLDAARSGALNCHPDFVSAPATRDIFAIRAAFD